MGQKMANSMTSPKSDLSPGPRSLDRIRRLLLRRGCQDPAAPPLWALKVVDLVGITVAPFRHIGPDPQALAANSSAWAACKMIVSIEEYFIEVISTKFM